MGLDCDGHLVISAIYDESVAAKDGRLKVGDHVLRVCFGCLFFKGHQDYFINFSNFVSIGQRRET